MIAVDPSRRRALVTGACGGVHFLKDSDGEPS